MGSIPFWKHISKYVKHIFHCKFVKKVSLKQKCTFKRKRLKKWFHYIVHMAQFSRHIFLSAAKCMYYFLKKNNISHWFLHYKVHYVYMKYLSMPSFDLVFERKYICNFQYPLWMHTCLRPLRSKDVRGWILRSWPPYLFPRHVWNYNTTDKENK